MSGLILLLVIKHLGLLGPLYFVGAIGAMLCEFCQAWSAAWSRAYFVTVNSEFVIIPMTWA